MDVPRDGRGGPTRRQGRRPRRIRRKRCRSPTRATTSTSWCASTRSAPNNGVFWVGVAIGVRLKNDPTLYRSDRGAPGLVAAARRSRRDDGAPATGHAAGDIAEIDAIRVPFGPDTGVSVQVDGVNRAFFLGRRDLPGPSFFVGRDTRDAHRCVARCGAQPDRMTCERPTRARRAQPGRSRSCSVRSRMRARSVSSSMSFTSGCVTAPPIAADTTAARTRASMPASRPASTV